MSMECSTENIPPGCKQTEVGVIPENWGVKTLAELFTFQNGVNADKSSYGSGIPFINVLEVITHPTIMENRIPGRISLSAQSISSFAVQRGDILFNRTSETQEEVGLTSVYIGNEVVVFGGFVIRARPKDSSLDPIFTSYVLRSPIVRSQIIARGQGAVRANIGQQDLSRILVVLPTKTEQEAIAEALSDADALIESLEQLIAKKRQIKQGAMQELLTGKRRLTGFNGEWEVKRLGDITEIRSGGTPSTTQPQFWDGDVLWCTPTDITSLKGHKYLSDTNRRITLQGLKSSSAEIIPAKSVVMTSRATIGECAINQVPISTNQGFKNLIPSENVDVEFLYYLLLTKKQEFISLCGGSTFLEIGKSQLLIFEVKMPDTKVEQEAISSILSDVDSEITAIEEKLYKARQIKQGMMQELLTGRIRLV